MHRLIEFFSEYMIYFNGILLLLLLLLLLYCFDNALCRAVSHFCLYHLKYMPLHSLLLLKKSRKTNKQNNLGHRDI